MPNRVWISAKSVLTLEGNMGLLSCLGGKKKKKKIGTRNSNFYTKVNGRWSKDLNVKSDIMIARNPG